MRSYLWIAASFVLVVGCKKTKGTDPNGPTAPNDRTMNNPAPNAKPSDPPAEPVARDPNADKPSDTEVRAPVAADLATYTKDLTGSGPLTATIETSMGTFHCELFGDKAPITVANFVGLATGKKPWLNPKDGNVETGKPYFDGLPFHRVIPGFMIQGGDPLGNGTGGPGYDFDNEISPDLRIKAGVLAMANAGTKPDGHGTDGSQFFITENADHAADLNGGYTIFGQCKEPELVKKIASVPRDGNDRPNDPVTITKVTISK